MARSILDYCRECRAPLEPEHTYRLCDEHQFLAGDYRRYDALCEEGYSVFQAKLMAGLADPPDPDDE